MNGLREELFALQHQVNFFYGIGCGFCTVFALVRSSAVSAFAMLNVLPKTHCPRWIFEAEEDCCGAGVSEARLFLCGAEVRGTVQASVFSWNINDLNFAA